VSSGVYLLRIWHKLNVEDEECLVVYCSRSKRRMMELGMAEYEVTCVGIENPICFARFGMVSIRSHVSRELHELVATVRMSWPSCSIVSASTSARCFACSGVTGMYELSWVSVGGSGTVGSFNGASVRTCVCGYVVFGVSLELGL